MQSMYFIGGFGEFCEKHLWY